MKNEDAVSPVIGVILMVAITVIMAAIIAAFVFSMSGTVQKTKTVAATVTQDENDIYVTYQGGIDNPAIQWLNVTMPNSDDCDLTYTTIKESGGKIGTGLDDDQEGVKPNVGAVYILDECGTAGNDNIVVVGHFNDGSEQVILTTTV